MILDKPFEAFVNAAPISVMMRAILENTFSSKRIDDTFEQSAESQYTRVLPFSTVADLMSEVVFNISPSIGAAIQANIEEIEVSRKSVYNKLNGTEPRVSAALVHDTARRLEPVIKELDATLPSELPGYRVKILDGNHFSATEHRLKELRAITDAPLPGKALVVLSPQLMLATKVIPCEDGHAQERALLKEVLADIQPNDLWIGDRNFCTFGFMFAIEDRRAKFLFRPCGWREELREVCPPSRRPDAQHGTVKGTLLGSRKFKRRIATGAVYQQRLRLTCQKSGQSLIVRRITIELDEPTRNGEQVIHVLTNVGFKDADARKLACLYQSRWSIETMFFELTETLTCEIKTLAYPKAAILAFCLALAAYNGISLIKAALRAVHGQQRVKTEVSGYYISLEIAKTYTGMMIAIPDENWTIFSDLTIVQLAELLVELAKHVVISKYQKHQRAPKTQPPCRMKMSNGHHVSTARILAKRTR